MFVPSWFVFVPSMIISYQNRILSDQHARQCFRYDENLKDSNRMRSALYGSDLGCINGHGKSENVSFQRISPIWSRTSFWKMKVWIRNAVIWFHAIQMESFIWQRRIVMNINLKGWSVLFRNSWNRWIDKNVFKKPWVKRK